MERSTFTFNSYKLVMAFRLGGDGRRGQLTRAAEALNCQRSYLSRVINGDLHLTPDHAFQLTKFWLLNADESEFFRTLVDWERASNLEYRTHLKSRLVELRHKNESIQERTKRKHLSAEGLTSQYFSNWIWGAIHFLTCIPEYQDVDSIAGRLGLRRKMVIQFLNQLKEQGLVTESKGKWHYRSGEFHVAKDSPLGLLHHQNWRHRALMDSQDLSNKNIHFTGILTISTEDYERIKEMLLEFIKHAQAIATPSTPEDAVALTCDFFSI